MTFKMKSGNKVSFKNMGSSPAKQTKQEIKQATKTAKYDAKGEGSEGGKKITPSERGKIRDDKYASQLSRAEGLEAAGKGEKGFGWKKAGMAILQGQGLMGAAMAGIGKGRDKSAIIADKIAKRTGEKSRTEEGRTKRNTARVTQANLETEGL